MVRQRVLAAILAVLLITLVVWLLLAHNRSLETAGVYSRWKSQSLIGR